MGEAGAGEEIRWLGRFVPSQWQPETIQQEILPSLPPCCQRERINIRMPCTHPEPPHPNNLAWHQDGGGARGTTRHIIVWASEQPTELQTSAGVPHASAPYDLMWVDNTRAFHRQPAGTDGTRRWFVTIRCSGVCT